MKSTKKSLFTSVLALFLCFSMLLGTTFAWFTDTVTSTNNKIVAGSLKVDLELFDKETGTWESIKNSQKAIFNHKNWEPGYTEVKILRITNKGSLALKWDASIIPLDELTALADVIDVYVYSGKTAPNARPDRNNLEAEGYLKAGTLREFAEGLDTESASALLAGESDYLGIALKMRTNAGNEYKNISCGEFDIRIVATQYSAESEKDSFDENYDSGAQFPVFKPADVNLGVKTQNGVVTEDAYKKTGSASMKVPAGTKTTKDRLGLTVSEMATSSSNVQLEENEILLPLDVHVDGVASDNTTAIIITLDEAMMTGLNIGNYKLYHIEDGVSNLMTAVSSLDELDAHNEFYYDPATGNVSLAMATFSEVAVVAEPAKWEGKRDYTWYTNAVATVDGESVTEYVIANADQLAAFGAIVGGMDGQTQDSFSGKTVKLIADINIGDLDSENGIVFYPIGYNSSDGKYEKTGVAVTTGFYNFCGTFDGNGHTISNFYHNTWEMKGDNNYYDATLQYYRDGMGLFGRVYGGTVKNLTVDNFSSDGEYTTTGVIAAYADGATFENITIFNCNPRVYNIGNGGIVGCVGWYAKEAYLTTTFKNITVDNSNKISALWGSYDVACGGIVGQYYPTSGQTSAGTPKNGGISFENCHISAQMDVYNDVCANYQYYAYRYTGMLIGSIRENVTSEDGHVYPKMDGITAKDCTVHFGTWNDYYYCEFEKNGHPSYSGPDDYKFSRVDKSEIIFDENGNATGCTHNHTDAEDNRAVYLQFNNLVTGYGWGVTTKVVGELNGVTILDRENGNSVEKFEGKVTELANNKEYKLGDIFNFVDKGVELIPGALAVSVHNLDKNNPVSATVVYDRNNWENSTITLTGAGKVQITIQDYYFCTPTTITVNVTARQNEEKFESKFTGNFLYRVGNQNTVSLSSLFAAKDSVTDGTVSVTVEAVNGTSASGTYSNNAIQFNGTGVVKVTIKDDDSYCIPTVLYLEVVDATNLTSATGTTTGGNFVLLCDVNTSTYVNYWYCTLYGNGFTYSLKGAPTAYNSKQGHGILITKNATLDNLVIVGDVYNSYGAYTSQDYYNTAIDVVGDTTIQNCYIANCAAPVKARSNVTIKNSILYGGTVANLLIMSGTATLENVTTANYDDGRAMVGMGIVIHSDATETAKLVLNGTLTQYNFISESKVPTDTYAKNLHDAMFNSNCSQYQFGTSPNRYVNTGIISLTATFNGEDITDNAKTGYVGKSLKVSSYDGYVYTQANTSGSVNNNFPEYKPTTQGAVPPSYSFDYTNKNYVAKTDGSNDYCYEENGKVNISMDQGDTFNWDTSILTIGKGITNYTVSMNGTDYTGKSITFNTAGDYTVTYTYTDDNNYKLDANGNIITYSVTYTKTVNITVAVVKATTKHAEFTFGSSNTASKTVTAGNSTYVMPNVSGTSSTIGSTTVNGQTIYYPIVEIIMSDGKTSHSSGWYAYFPVFSGAVTITDYANNGTGDKMTPYNGSTTTMPSGLSVVGDPTQLFKYQSSSAAGSTPVVKSNKLVYSSASISANRDEYNTVIQYSYTDNAGATYYYYIGYHAAKQTYKSCVTGDTLVTLADGTQKRIDEVTYADQLLVWNFYTGKYDVSSASILMNHGASDVNVTTLRFSDGTSINTINGHGFFDVATNEFVLIDEFNAADYVGHSFVRQDSNGYSTVELVSYSVEKQYTEVWSILTSEYYNCVLEGMWTVTAAEVDNSPEWLMPYVIGEDMKYDEAMMQADIAEYGLYTYEDFKDHCTYEQFVALGLENFKVSVGKGYITWDEILYLMNLHIPQ